MTDTLGSRVTGTKNVAIRSHTRLRLLSQLRTVALEVMAMPPSKIYNKVPSQGSMPLVFILSNSFNVLLLLKGGHLPLNLHYLKVPITPKYIFFCLNKSLHLFETHCAFLNLVLTFFFTL